MSNPKSRSNYMTGEWCGKRANCKNDKKVKCNQCFKFSQFVAKEK